GGQYSTSPREEADVELGTDLFGEQAPLPASRPVPNGPDLRGRDHAWADLRGQNLERALATEVNFSRADLRGARMSGIVADGANFTRADLTGADIAGASFREADFTDAKLGEGVQEADLHAANLERAEIHD